MVPNHQAPTGYLCQVKLTLPPGRTSPNNSPDDSIPLCASSHIDLFQSCDTSPAVSGEVFAAIPRR